METRESRRVTTHADNSWRYPGTAYAAAISQAHCFNDGNKRTAFQVMDVVLDLKEVQMAWDTEVVGQKMVLLAESKLGDEMLAQWLRQDVSQRAVLSSE